MSSDDWTLLMNNFVESPLHMYCTTSSIDYSLMFKICICVETQKSGCQVHW